PAARRRANGLLPGDAVPAPRRGVVEQRVVSAADEVARRVEVHVHPLDDHAFLPLDLLGLEARIADHVDEDVERDVTMLRGRLEVVARVLLAGERVELAPDRVDLAGELARGGTPLRA